MRAFIVWPLALSCWAVPVLAREGTPAIGHELTRRAPLDVPAKTGQPAAIQPKVVEESSCAAPEGVEDARFVENITGAARADVETSPPEALAGAAAGAIRRLEAQHPGRAESVRPYYLYAVCQVLRERGVTGGALKAALLALDQQLAQVEKAPASGQSEPVSPTPVDAESAPAKAETAPAPAPAEPAISPQAPAADPADPSPAVEAAIRETNEKLAPPDEQKAIDFALTPFENGRDGQPVAGPEAAPAQTPAVQAEPPSPSPSGGQESGDAPQKTDSPEPGKESSRGGALEQPAVDECVALGVTAGCDGMAAALAGVVKAPPGFDYPRSMESGGKSEISLALRVDRVEAAVSDVKASDALSAQLLGAGFEIQPKGLREQRAPFGQEMKWTWIVSPNGVGAAQDLKLELYAHPAGRDGAKPPLLIRTLDARIDVNALPPSRIASHTRIVEPAVYAGAAALVMGLGAALVFLRRGRDARPELKPGLTDGPGEVLGDLRETTGVMRPFRAPPRAPDAHGGDQV